MKTIDARPIRLGMAVLCAMLLFSQSSFPQSSDTLTGASSGSLQFQLIGGLGAYYIGSWEPTSYCRIGADVSLSHASASGDGDSYNSYPGGGSTTLNSPDQQSTSYGISISGVYLRRIARYANASLYGGAGPMVSYSFRRSSNTSTAETIQASTTTVETYSNDDTQKTWGIGPLVLVGVKNRLVDHVSLSAEMSLSALYQWKASSYGSLQTSNYSPSYTTSSSNGSNSHLKGWDISLSGIRIGVILEL